MFLKRLMTKIMRLIKKIIYPGEEEKVLHKIEQAIPRYKKIEAGEVLPTFEEFYKICIFLQMDQGVNLRKLYPTLYKQYLRDIQMSWISDELNNPDD